MKELIIDITYKCNSSCKYCQWNAKNGKEIKKGIPIDNILVPPKTLNTLCISRIVLSGGEPLLASKLGRILKYYGNLSLDLRLLTNGFNLSLERLKKFLKTGLDEYVFSIDALDYNIFSKIREKSRKHYSKMLKNLKHCIDLRKKNIISFLGLTVVLTKLNCNLKVIKKLIEYCQNNKIDQIKFQPVYDDGFLSMDSPQLKLDEECVNEIKKIMQFLEARELNSFFTNPVGFWKDLQQLLIGKNLNPRNCTLDNNSILLHDGIFKFCFWFNYIDYGGLSDEITKKSINLSISKFRKNLGKCKVKPQCFCLQPINHIWSQ
ncbi:MAG: radical SAM protein [Candidatus Lokiarchaeota archaeon]|nr:radical SAM protein [Candidatus Lokiarchaeota archaeon]